MGVKKYFLAIVIPGPLFEKTEAVKTALFHSHGLKGALRSPAHITLHRPFEWKEEKEERLIEILRNFSFDTSFQIALDGFAFFEPRVIYVNVRENTALFDLHAHLKRYAARQLGLLNEVNDLRGFHPHVTVAFRDLKTPKFYELKPEFEKKEFEGRFDYTGFSLLKLDTNAWKEARFFAVQ